MTIRFARTLRPVALVALLLALDAMRLAAVSVSPVALYIDSRSRQGTLTLYNPGTLPEEIQVGFAFGYPVSDDQGNVTVPLVDTAPPGEPSAVPWLRAFPTRMVLEPGQRQVVRIMVQPPAGIDEGEYWARVLVRARGGQPPIEERRGGVAVQIDVETVVVVALNYRNGDVSTGLEPVSTTAELVGDTLHAGITVRRTGNAAFLGRVLVEALDERGEVVGQAEEVLAVYRELHRRLSVPVTARPARVRYTMDTNRDDLPPGGALPVDPLVVEVPVP